jgi:predicted RNA binding protein YcfA (HicA-like mRNA interferase family)
MTRRAPRITADQAIRIVARFGFIQVRQSGSHKIFRNPQGIRITIPYHKGKILHPKLVKAMARDIGISIEEFLQEL